MFIKLNKKGFTLVEIMIVVAIIGLLAAIAIPNLLRARINANEGAVKSDLRTFSSACESYRAAQNPPTYPPAVTTLTGSSPTYLDSSWEGSKHGYSFTYKSDAAAADAAAGTPAVTGNTYSLLATPVSSSTAVNKYCVDQTGVIVVGPTGSANSGCTAGTAING